VIGGRFSILELSDNEKIDHFGVYLEIERSRKLSFTLEVPRHYSGVSKVAIEIKQKATGCEMIFTQSEIDVTKTEESWKKMFNNLKVLLEK